jgi:acyl carrier protein
MPSHLTEPLKQLLAETLRDTDGLRPVGDDDDIVNDLGLDSLQMMSFLLAVEDRFSIQLDFERLDLASLGSVTRFAAFLAEHLEAQSTKARSA